MLWTGAIDGVKDKMIKNRKFCKYGPFRLKLREASVTHKVQTYWNCSITQYHWIQITQKLCSLRAAFFWELHSIRWSASVRSIKSMTTSGILWTQLHKNQFSARRSVYEHGTWFFTGKKCNSERNRLPASTKRNTTISLKRKWEKPTNQFSRGRACRFLFPIVHAYIYGDNNRSEMKAAFYL